ncbi:MAG: hypothetical protein V4760_19270 [Bdellovibrionota bacterium]
MLRFVLFALAATIAMTSEANAQVWHCDQRTDPHSFGCQENVFNGASEFPLVEMDLQVARGEWFATTYATPRGNRGDGFVMDVDPANPRRPGRGVLNVPGRMLPPTVMGVMSINGFNSTFENWQNARMDSVRSSVHAIDRTTIEFEAIDRWGISHLFQCRNFLRHQTEHLTCKWMLLEQSPRGPRWSVKGYFGFLRLEAWNDFIRSSSGR